MHQLIQSALRAATGAIDAGGGIEHAPRIKAVLGRVEFEQHHQGHQQNQNASKPPGQSRPGTQADLGWLRGIVQWKEALISGLLSTTRAQIPMGKPTRQQGEIQGIMAMMLAPMQRL